MHVRMLNPSRITHAAKLVKFHEVSQPFSQKPNSRFTISPQNQSLFHKPTNFLSNPPLPHTLVPSNANTTTPPLVSPKTTPLVSPKTIPKPASNRPTRTYYAIEMVNRRAKGLCIFYDEQFTLDNQFKHKISTHDFRN